MLYRIYRTGIFDIKLCSSRVNLLQFQSTTDSVAQIVTARSHNIHKKLRKLCFFSVFLSYLIVLKAATCDIWLLLENFSKILVY